MFKKEHDRNSRTVEGIPPLIEVSTDQVQPPSTPKPSPITALIQSFEDPVMSVLHSRLHIELPDILVYPAIYLSWPPASRFLHSNSCEQCKSKYSLYLRQHHCRACGRSLCHACSSKHLAHPNNGNKQVRCCQTCFDVATTADLFSGSSKNINIPDIVDIMAQRQRVVDYKLKKAWCMQHNVPLDRLIQMDVPLLYHQNQNKSSQKEQSISTSDSEDQNTATMLCPSLSDSSQGEENDVGFPRSLQYKGLLEHSNPVETPQAWNYSIEWPQSDFYRDMSPWYTSNKLESLESAPKAHNDSKYHTSSPSQVSDSPPVNAATSPRRIIMTPISSLRQQKAIYDFHHQRLQTDIQTPPLQASPRAPNTTLATPNSTQPKDDPPELLKSSQRGSFTIDRANISPADSFDLFERGGSSLDPKEKMKASNNIISSKKGGQSRLQSEEKNDIQEETKS